MKKSYIVLILLLGILGWGLYIYQARQNDALIKKVGDSVLGEVDYRFKTEQRIKTEMETRRKEAEFLQRREAQREFEEAVEEKVAELASMNKSSLEQVSGELSGRIAGLDNKLSEIKNEIAGDRRKMGRMEAGFAAGLKESKEENLARISAVMEKLDKYAEELTECRKKIKLLGDKVAVQKDEIAESAKVISEQAKQIKKLEIGTVSQQPVGE